MVAKEGVNGWREAQRERWREGRGSVLCFHPQLERVVFLLQLCIGGRQVLDPFLMVSLCSAEFGGLGLEVFDVGSQGVHNMGFLVGACHGDGSIGGSGRKLDGD